MPNMIQIMKQAALDAVENGKPVNIVYGTVISAAPLKIQIDQKLTLEGSTLVLTRNVTDYHFDMTVAHTTEKSTDAIDTRHSHPYSGTTEEATIQAGEGEPVAHAHGYAGTTEVAGTVATLEHDHAYSGRKSFTVHNGLQAGEQVILLRVQGGQRFVVLDRVVSG